MHIDYCIFGCLIPSLIQHPVYANNQLPASETTLHNTPVIN